MIDHKINTVSSLVLKRSMFENKTSYDRFVKGFSFLSTLQEYKDQGHLIMKEGELINGDFILRLDDEGLMPRIGERTHLYCLSCWLGCTYGLKENTIYVGAEEMKIFNGIKIIDPSYAKEFKI